MKRTTLSGLFIFLLSATYSLHADPSVQSILSATEGKATLGKPITVTLQWSRNDHPPKTHGYKYFAEKWKGLLDQVDGVTAHLAEGFPDAAQWQKSDLVIVYLTQQFLDEKKFRIMQDYIARGGDLIVLHQGMVQRKHSEKWADVMGIAFQFGQPKSSWGKHADPIYLNTEHPIFAGFPKTLQYKDELYWNLIQGKRGKVNVIGHTRAPKQAADDHTKHPVFWTVEEGSGEDQSRVFGCVIGHWDSIFDEAHFQIALLRATGWVLGESVKPFEAVTTVQD